MKNYITKLENGEKALNAAFDKIDNFFNQLNTSTNRQLFIISGVQHLIF